MEKNSGTKCMVSKLLLKFRHMFFTFTGGRRLQILSETCSESNLKSRARKRGRMVKTYCCETIGPRFESG
jgi:hypothetical protein